MRQGQQSRRGRGRGRKVQNPLSRNYESNGPDVKIRGTASHIAEKYATLARDALASGDTVTAENFFQHAEHYNRIIMAAQAQYQSNNQPTGDAVNGSGNPRGRRRNEPDAEATAKTEAETPAEPEEAAPAKEEAAEAAPAEKPKKKSNGSAASKKTANGSGGELNADAATPKEDGPSEGPVA